MKAGSSTVEQSDAENYDDTNFKSPYRPNCNIEANEPAFEMLQCLLDPTDTSPSTEQTRANAHGGGSQLVDRMTQAKEYIHLSKEVFSPKWGLDYELLDDELVLCLDVHKLTEANAESLHRMIEHMELWDMLLILLDDLDLNTKDTFNDLFRKVKDDDGWRQSLSISKTNLHCLVFLCRTYRCLKLLKWMSIQGSLARKVQRCLKILQKNSTKKTTTETGAKVQHNNSMANRSTQTSEKRCFPDPNSKEDETMKAVTTFRSTQTSASSLQELNNKDGAIEDCSRTDDNNGAKSTADSSSSFEPNEDEMMHLVATRDLSSSTDSSDRLSQEMDKTDTNIRDVEDRLASNSATSDKGAKPHAPSSSKNLDNDVETITNGPISVNVDGAKSIGLSFSNNQNKEGTTHNETDNSPSVDLVLGDCNAAEYLTKKSTSKKDVDDDSIREPTENDVFVGRGNYHNEGNKTYRSLLAEYKIGHFQANGQKMKNEVVKRVLTRVHESGSRVLVKGGEANKNWVEAPIGIAIKAVSSSLIDRLSTGQLSNDGNSSLLLAAASPSPNPQKCDTGKDDKCDRSSIISKVSKREEQPESGERESLDGSLHNQETTCTHYFPSDGKEAIEAIAPIRVVGFPKSPTQQQCGVRLDPTQEEAEKLVFTGRRTPGRNLSDGVLDTGDTIAKAQNAATISDPQDTGNGDCSPDGYCEPSKDDLVKSNEEKSPSGASPHPTGTEAMSQTERTKKRRNKLQKFKLRAKKEGESLNLETERFGNRKYNVLSDKEFEQFLTQLEFRYPLKNRSLEKKSGSYPSKNRNPMQKCGPSQEERLKLRAKSFKFVYQPPKPNESKKEAGDRIKAMEKIVNAAIARRDRAIMKCSMQYMKYQKPLPSVPNCDGSYLHEYNRWEDEDIYKKRIDFYRLELISLKNTEPSSLGKGVDSVKTGGTDELKRKFTSSSDHGSDKTMEQQSSHSNKRPKPSPEKEESVDDEARNDSDDSDEEIIEI